jgi:pimeloyl-ACP methyl ester carboxylesterase
MQLPVKAPAPETIVLVHGIWMHSVELLLLAWRLRRCGYRTRLFNYRSVRRPVRHNATRLATRVRQLPPGRIHLVGHSLGGLVILQAMQDNPDLVSGCIVLLGSPAGGSAVARRIARRRLLRWLIGRSGEQGLLGGGPHWRGRQSLGVIAGRHSLGIGRLFGGLRGTNDGVVNLEETVIEGVTQSIIMNTTHIGLLFSKRVAGQICAFLKHGRFAADSAAA